MLNKWLSKFFIKKECYKCKELIDKTRCIREHLIVSPYSKEYAGLQIKFIDNNVTTAIHGLKALKNTIDVEDYNIRKITENNIETMHIGKWFTDNEYNILDEIDSTWKEYLDLNIWLIEWYNENNNMTKGRSYAVSLKIKPYIINIEEVANTLIEYQKQELNM